MPREKQSRKDPEHFGTSWGVERILILAGQVTALGVYGASLLYLPELRQLPALIPYTLLYVAFGLGASWDPPAEAPAWQHGSLMLVRAALVSAIFLLAGEAIGLIPILYFIIVPHSYFVLPLRRAVAFTLLCLALLFLGFLLVGGVQMALALLPPYAGGLLFFAAASAALMQQGRERERAEQLLAALEEAHRRLQEYATQVEALAVVEERNRLAREIHDSLGHFLTAITRQLEVAGKLLPAQPERAGESIAKAEELARESLAEVRCSVAALRSSPLDTAALDQAIAELVEQVRAGGISATLSTAGEPYALSTAANLTLYRAAQEGLTNVSKHAKASAVVVDLTYEPQQVSLTITDNGVGGRRSTGDGYGLLGLRERLALLGGSLEAGDRDEGGFRLCLVVPRQGRADE
jgi:signal transduction histidine kinase